MMARTAERNQAIKAGEMDEQNLKSREGCASESALGRPSLRAIQISAIDLHARTVLCAQCSVHPGNNSLESRNTSFL